MDISFRAMWEENHRVHAQEEDGVSDKGGLSKLQAQPVKTHVCPRCGKAFSSRKALGGHMSVVHSRCKKNLSKTKQIKNQQSAEFVCPRCGMDFRSEKAVHGHMRMHSDRYLKAHFVTESSVVDEFPDLWNLANVAVMVMEDDGDLDNANGREIVSDPTSTSSYFCSGCSLADRLELADDGSSKEPESMKFMDGKFIQSSPVDGLEGTSCVVAKKLTWKKLKKSDSNLLQKTETEKKNTDF